MTQYYARNFNHHQGDLDDAVGPFATREEAQAQVRAWSTAYQQFFEDEISEGSIQLDECSDEDCQLFLDGDGDETREFTVEEITEKPTKHAWGEFL